MNNTIKSLSSAVTSSFNYAYSRLSGRNFAAYVTSAALAVLGGLVAYRYTRPLKSAPDLRSTDLRSYVVVTPSEESGFHQQVSKTDRQRLYLQAKACIQALPSDFTSKVDFNDSSLEIGFKYDRQILSMFANHETLWFIFSAEKCFKPHARDTIFDFVSSKFCVKNLFEADCQLRREQKEFEAQSKQFFVERAVVKSIPDFKDDMIFDCKQMLAAIFKQSKGISIGEMHRQNASKTFLVTEMQALVDHNVEVLFVEGLTESLQRDLDAYFESNTPVEAMPLSIKYKFGYLDALLSSQGGYTWIDVIKAAKKSGIKRVVGIDTELSNCSKRELEKGEHCLRLMTMNYFAQQVIEREMPQGNYVVVSGAAHAATDLETGVAGISQLFGIPSILVHDGHVPLVCNMQGREITFPMTDKKSDFRMRPDFNVAIPVKK